jgi:hypothetical protein
MSRIKAEALGEMDDAEEGKQGSGKAEGGGFIAFSVDEKSDDAAPQKADEDGSFGEEELPFVVDVALLEEALEEFGVKGFLLEGVELGLEGRCGRGG